MRAPWAGSRARSREIGYAQAMLEMSAILRDAGESWRKEELAAADDGEIAIAAMYGRIGSWLDSYSSHALRTWEIHVHRDGTFVRDVEHLAFLEREYGGRPARRELPEGEHSGNS